MTTLILGYSIHRPEEIECILYCVFENFVLFIFADYGTACRE